MIRIVIAAAAALAIGVPASAQTAEAPKDPDRLEIVPMIEARARFESVDQAGLDAQALTVRLRAGAEARLGAFSLLAEGEATIALVDDYNAFAFPIAGESQRRPQFAVVADPENAEINRLQLQYKVPQGSLTVGRQRINLDDQRWVGSVGWRQNEQTFDALRGEARAGPVGIDITYAISQRTIFGQDAGPRTALGGNFVFAGLSSKLGPVQAKLFAYLLDYDEAFFLTNSSQTYGGTMSGHIPLPAKTRLSLRASYARQLDHGGNPQDYAANYWAFEGGTSLGGFTITAGWERLGSDGAGAVQTPMATLHKFNGWADMFLTTPASGLEDAYASIGRDFGTVGPFRKLNVNLAVHQFDSARSDIEYGTEWDASAGFTAGPFRFLLKYADFNSARFGTDTRKLWLQAEWAL